MCEAVDFFRQSLDEQGLSADVAHESDEHKDTFYVSKEVAGEKITFSTDVSHTIQYNTDTSMEKEIAMAARAVADKFEEHLTETIEWGENYIVIRPYDEPEAACGKCGSTVGIPSHKRFFASSAELSAPHPMPLNEESVLDCLTEYQQVLLKMYLIGRLRETCDDHCPNSNRKI